MTEESLFAAALAAADPAAFLAAHCPDPALRARVAGLLAAHHAAGSFLAGPDVTTALPPAGADPGATHTVAPTDPDATADPRAACPAGGDAVLAFLKPSARPGALGRIDHYDVLEVVGSGGFGTVMKAFDARLHRVVAVKVLAPQLAASGAARARFLREARTAAAVKDEHVVNVHAVSDDDAPVPYLVMEFVAGQTLQQKLDKAGPLPPKEALRVGMQAAKGLAAAHAQGLIHRDIKPANILLENGVERVKITDFGLARAADDASLSQSGVVAGTPMYMSPEQARGDALDTRSDLFSLGSVLYALCTGRPPFRAETTLAVLKRVIEDDPRPVREVNAEVPRWLADVVAKLHAKNPADRFQTAPAVAELLGAYLAELQQQGTVTPQAGVAPPRRAAAATGWVWWFAVPLVLFALLSAGAVLPEPGGPDEPSRREALFALTYGYGFFAGVGLLQAAWMSALSRRWAWRFGAFAAAAAVVAGVCGGLGLVTPERPAAPPAVAPPPPPDSDGFVPLFNGKDLTGWKAHPDAPGGWRVENGHLVSTRAAGYLFSDRGDWQDFHLRAEAHVTEGGNSGVFFRTPFRLTRVGEPDLFAPAGWYEADLFWGPVAKPGRVRDLGETPVALAAPNQWLTLEVIARGTRIVTKVNGTVAVDVTDAKATFARGHFALQAFTPSTAVRFRKIEVKELPPEPPPPPPAVAPFTPAEAKAHQAAWAKHLGVPVEFTNDLGMAFRLIPPGEYDRGTPAAEADALARAAPPEEWFRDFIRSEAPARRVAIAEPFYLGAHEVTADQFAAFAAATGHRTADEKSGRGGVMYIDGADTQAPAHTWQLVRTAGGGDRPVGFVLPADADAMADWLTGRDGLRYGLPTEDQWEYACRAGTGGAAFCPPNRLAEFAQLDLPGFPLAPVGRKAANPFGLFDVFGNQGEMARGPGGVVVRGGHGAPGPFGPFEARCAARKPLWKQGEVGSLHQGLRLAITGDLRAAVKQAAWVPLFDGKTLAGWQTHPDQRGAWVVEDGVLTCAGKRSHLFTDREFGDHRVRVEMTINGKGTSGVFLRAGYGAWSAGKSPVGYEVNVSGYDGSGFKTGDVFFDEVLARVKDNPIYPNEWFTLEVEARGNRLRVFVNGKEVASAVDEKRRAARGRIALQHYGPATSLHVRRVEVMELPPRGELLIENRHPTETAAASVFRIDATKGVWELRDSVFLDGGKTWTVAVEPGEYEVRAEDGTRKLPDFNQRLTVAAGTTYPVPFWGAAAPPAPEPGWAPLFNGTDLTGLTTPQRQAWAVKDGVLTANGPVAVEAAAAAGDAHHRVELMLTGSKGVTVSRTGVQVGLTTGAQPGGLLHSADGKPGATTPLPAGLLRPGEWATVELVTRGAELAVRVDGKEVGRAALAGPPPAGKVGLTVPQGTVHVRRWEVKTPAPAWQPLFDGKTLAGWKTHASQPGEWVVTDGAITCTGPQSHLFSDREFGDHRVRVEMKVNDAGDGGVILRCRRGGFTVGGSGRQPQGYEVHAAGKAGAYGTGSVFYVGPLATVKGNPVRPDEWFTLEAEARGNHLTVWVDGTEVARFADDKDRRAPGPLALQHQTPATRVFVRKVEVLELPRLGAAAQARRDLVAAKEKDLAAVKARFDAGLLTRRDVAEAEVGVIEAALDGAPGAAAVRLLGQLVEKHGVRREVVAQRVEAGAVRPETLAPIDADIARAKARLAEARKAEPPPAAAPFTAEQARAHQAAWAKHLGVPPEVTNDLGMAFRVVPAGSFRMGSTPAEVDAVLADAPDLKGAEAWIRDRVRSEAPARKVTIPEPFLLATHEVTVGQFREFVRATGYKTHAEQTGGGAVWDNAAKTWAQDAGAVWHNPKYAATESHPATFLNPADARAFCAWLGKQDGRTYALPTEEQWEFACRAGTATRWWFGDDPAGMKDRGWTVETAFGKHRPVGQPKANPFGLFDLHGNATEMATTPQGDVYERGGQANETAWRARSAWRNPVAEADRPHGRRGFRVAVVGDPAPRAWE